MSKKEQLKEKNLLWDLSTSDLFYLWNDFCDSNHWERIYENDEETLIDYFHNDLREYFEEKDRNNNYYVHDDYFTIDGYGHLKSFDDLWDEIDESALIEWIDENDLYFTYFDELDFDEEEEEDEEE